MPDLTPQHKFPFLIYAFLKIFFKSKQCYEEEKKILSEKSEMCFSPLSAC